MEERKKCYFFIYQRKLRNGKSEVKPIDTGHCKHLIEYCHSVVLCIKYFLLKMLKPEKVENHILLCITYHKISDEAIFF